MHLSEEDIRTKVISEWLKNSGFSINNILIERTFVLKIGKQTKSFNPRADVLVKSDSGINLLVVEVKEPSHILKDEDIDQAISYARICKDGIIPFTILTNGNDTKIFDSVTKELINENSIPLDHPYVKSGYKPTSDGIKARMEALEYLITFSEENLITFCKGQVEDRMELLKGDNIYGGKKYIPSLIIEREDAKKEFKNKCLDNKKQLLLVVGLPQHGKTCFMCHTVEQFLLENKPCLFYPAISLKNGLLNSIQEDFEWCFGEQMTTSQWITRLNSIGKRQNKQIFIFIDGWNEMAEKALEINQECKRLRLSNISIVLSATTPSLLRLLTDNASNSTFIADEINIEKTFLRKLVTKPIKNTSKIGIIQLGKYNESEVIKAKEIYLKKFEIISIPNSILFSDPFFLRIACELYTKKEIPDNLTKTELLYNSLINKGARRGIGEFELIKKLGDLAKVFYENNRPSKISNFSHLFENENQLVPWRESGILSVFHINNDMFLDFYYTHDLDYSVGNLYKKWSDLFNSNKDIDIINELKSSIHNEVGESALLWFLSCPENYNLLEKIFDLINFEISVDFALRKILADSIIRQITLNKITNFIWLKKHLENIVNIAQESNIKFDELADLIFSYLTSLKIDDSSDDFKYWMRLLLKYDDSIDEMGVENSLINEIYDGELYPHYNDGSIQEISLFEEFMLDKDINIAKRSFAVFAYSSPYIFLENFVFYKNELIRSELDFQKILKEGCKEITQKLSDNYYGGMCKGWLLESENGDEDVKKEFLKMNALLPEIISIFPNLEFSNKLIRILEDLKNIGNVKVDQIDVLFIDPNQLNLDFLN
jgi:hypothetical protein